MKKRLLIFCFYDKTGIVDAWDIELLRQLKYVSNRIIFVVNGYINEESRSRISNYTDEIIIRENRGLDYGAYQYVILNYLKNNELKIYDELILCNNSFIGFFNPINDIFEAMEDKPFDLWGLNEVKRGIIDMIQSYLLVVKKKIIQSDVLVDYFQRNRLKGSNYGQVVAYLESKLYTYLKNKGYSLGSYTYTESYDIYANPDICITQYFLPIIKKKCFLSHYCDKDKIEKAVNSVKECELVENKMFPPYIKESNDMVGRRRIAKALIDENLMLSWADKDYFYIFGNGNIAHELYYTYFENNKLFKGFIESKKISDDEMVYTIEEVPNNSRVIVGVRQEIQNEIIELLPKSMTILKLWDV